MHEQSLLWRRLTRLGTGQGQLSRCLWLVAYRQQNVVVLVALLDVFHQPVDFRFRFDQEFQLKLKFH